jgi:hypothetical protein
VSATVVANAAQAAILSWVALVNLKFLALVFCLRCCLRDFTLARIVVILCI